MAINQITKVRLPDGQEVGLVEWSQRPLYSTVDIHSGVTSQEIYAFNYTEGETVTRAGGSSTYDRTATLKDTNIANPSSMDATEEFLCFGISVELFQFVADGSALDTDEAGLPVPYVENIATLHNRIILELEVSEKAFPQAGLGFFPAGFGVHGWNTTPTGGSARSYGVNGAPGAHALDDLQVPVHMGGTEDYNVILHNSTGDAITFRNTAGSSDDNAVIVARIYLRGLHKRATA